MELKECLGKINFKREEIEAPFVFCLWKEPDLFSDYQLVNDGKDKTLISEDALFYYSLGKQLYKQGFRSFDNMTLYTYLEDKPTIKKDFEDRGGYRAVSELMSLVNADNVGGYYDKIIKTNTLDHLCNKFFDTFTNIDKFNNMTNQDVYDFFDYQLNNISINTGHDVNIESLTLDDQFIEECDKGSDMGLNYGKTCPILNYLTLGIPLGEMTMIAGHSGVGKSSFSFENLILALNANGIKTAVISNEQRSKDFKKLLTVHILTDELNYWDLTRKKIKMGGLTQEHKDMLKKAQKISYEKYDNIKFVKLFDNDMNKVKKIIKKLAKLGYQAVLFDTMKSEDEVNESMWQQLLLHSRKLFQLASKENIALIPTYQLALSTLNVRYLNAGCLSNAKQIKEVFSEMIYIRPIWDDEYTGEKYDVKAYQLTKDADTGKYTKVKKMLTLDKEKKYIIAFLDKTRNDDDKQQVLYEFNGRFNKWVEVGYCTVVNEHK
jgi:replicative DNA helicase